MKTFFIITAIVFLLGSGSDWHSLQAKAARSMQFSKFFKLSSKQINGYLDNLDPQRLKLGVSVKEIANNIVKYEQEDWLQKDFHETISYYLDRDKYATSFIITGDEVKTIIFAKDSSPRVQLLSYLDSLDREILKHEGVSLTQVGNNVSYWQQHQAHEEFFRAIRWQALDGYVVRWAKRGKGNAIDMSEGSGRPKGSSRPRGSGRPKSGSKPRAKDINKDTDVDTGKQKRELRIFLAP